MNFYYKIRKPAACFQCLELGESKQRLHAELDETRSFHQQGAAVQEECDWMGVHVFIGDFLARQRSKEKHFCFLFATLLEVQTVLVSPLKVTRFPGERPRIFT